MNLEQVKKTLLAAPVSNLVEGVRMSSRAASYNTAHLPIGLENAKNLTLTHPNPMMQSIVFVLESSRQHVDSPLDLLVELAPKERGFGDHYGIGWDFFDRENSQASLG